MVMPVWMKITVVVVVVVVVISGNSIEENVLITNRRQSIYKQCA